MARIPKGERLLDRRSPSQSGLHHVSPPLVCRHKDESQMLQMAFDVFVDPLDIIIIQPSLSQQGHGLGSNRPQIPLVPCNLSGLSLTNQPRRTCRTFHGMIDPLDTVIAQQLRHNRRSGEQDGQVGPNAGEYLRISGLLVSRRSGTTSSSNEAPM